MKKYKLKKEEAHIASELKKNMPYYDPLLMSAREKEELDLEVAAEAKIIAQQIKQEKKQVKKEERKTKRKKRRRILIKWIFINNPTLILLIIGGVFGIFILSILLSLLPSFGGILDLTNNSNVNFPSKDDITNINGNFNAGVNGNLLTNSLISTIGEENYNKLNNSVKESIQSAGFCTKAASAAAASSLIEGLQSHNFRIPYYWGGGHGDGIYLGVDPNLGGAAGESCSDTNCYYKKGYDCSGFVSWAVSNAINRVVTYTTYGFMDISTPISFSEASAGDILVHENHVVLVIQNNGSSLLTAESAGGGVGTVFRTYDQNAIAASGFQIKSMSSYFDSVC